MHEEQRTVLGRLRQLMALPVDDCRTSKRAPALWWPHLEQPEHGMAINAEPVSVHTRSARRSASPIREPPVLVARTDDQVENLWRRAHTHVGCKVSERVQISLQSPALWQTCCEAPSTLCTAIRMRVRQEAQRRHA